MCLWSTWTARLSEKCQVCGELIKAYSVIYQLILFILQICLHGKRGGKKIACLFLNHLTNLRTMWLNKQSLCFSYSLTIQALCLLLLCSFRLIYHGPVNFGILSKTMHGDVLEIAWLSAISSRALKEASNHARQHLSLGKLIFKLKTHNLRPLMFTKSGSKTFWEAFKKKRKATLAVFCCNTKH